MFNNNRVKIDVRVVLLVLLGSLSISLWSVFVDPVVNIDAILYIEVAQAFISGNINTVFGIYKWPFYPLLISLTHQVTGLSLITSAHVLTFIFNVLTCIAFVALILKLGGSQITILIAAIVIVFFPGLNEIRSFIIRDHGYIAFYFLSLYFLVQSLGSCSKISLLACLICMFIATLFRIEGVSFLIAIPTIYLVSRGQAKSDSGLTLYFLIGITLLVLFSVFGWWLYSPAGNTDISLFSQKNIQNGWNQASQYLNIKIEAIKQHILNTSSDTRGRLVYLWTSAGIIFTHILLILSIPYAYLSWYALSNKFVFQENHSYLVWKYFVILNILILAVFTLTKLFLTQRYPLALAVTLLICVPFALEHIYLKWKSISSKSFKNTWKYLVLVLLLCVNSFEGLTSVSRHYYLKEAGIWLKENIEPTSRLMADEKLIGFYSGLGKEYLSIMPRKDVIINSLYKGEWILYDYLALKVSSDPEYEGHIEKTLWVDPEKIFTNDRQSEIRIYNIKKYRERETQ